MGWWRTASVVFGVLSAGASLLTLREVRLLAYGRVQDARQTSNSCWGRLLLATGLRRSRTYEASSTISASSGVTGCAHVALPDFPDEPLQPYLEAAYDRLADLETAAKAAAKRLDDLDAWKQAIEDHAEALNKDAKAALAWLGATAVFAVAAAIAGYFG